MAQRSGIAGKAETTGAERASQIDAELVQLIESVRAMGAVIAQHEVRINDVLTPSRPEANTQSVDKEPVDLVARAAKLRSIKRDVQAYTSTLIDMTRRVEL